VASGRRLREPHARIKGHLLPDGTAVSQEHRRVLELYEEALGFMRESAGTSVVGLTLEQMFATTSKPIQTDYRNPQNIDIRQIRDAKAFVYLSTFDMISPSGHAPEHAISAMRIIIPNR
jgi:hypothetical protein